MQHPRFAFGIVFALALCIPACTNTSSTTAPGLTIDRDELKSDELSPVLPSDYQQRVKDYLTRHVAVPATAKYDFEQPEIASVTSDKQGSRVKGWAVPVVLHVTDRLGREVPPTTELFFFYPDGAMIEIPQERLQVEQEEAR